MLYDPFADRWIATACADLPPNTFSSSIFIAVSATGDPTGVWYRNRVYVDQTAQTWADFPSIGFDRDKIAVQVNMFSTNNNVFTDSRIFVFDKTNYYANNYRNYKLITLNSSGATQVPAITYDTNVSTLYFVQELYTNSFGSGFLKVYSMTGAFGSEIITNTVFFPSAIPWNAQGSPVNFAPQSGSSTKIHTGDSRMQRVVYRNGSLWCAHTIVPTNLPARSAIQWWQLNTNGAVVRHGLIDDPSGQKFYAYPSIAVNRFNDALIGYSSFSTNQYPSAAYSFRACNDSASAFEAETIFKAGTSSYIKTGGIGTNRWGDYSATMPDPINDTDFWSIQEFATNYVGTLTNNSGRWCTWWGKTSMVLPGNDKFTNYYVISNGIGSTNGTTVRATRESGEPNHAGNANTPSVWYRWMATNNGNVTFYTTPIGTSNDVALAVYRGTVVTNLTTVTNTHGTAPMVVFKAGAGTNYQIAVAGYNASCGDFVLHWVEPQAPMFTVQPGPAVLNVVAGSNVTYSAVAIGIPDPAYQWRFNGTNIGNALVSSFTITNSQITNSGIYNVVATNVSGSVTSSVSALTVKNSAAATLSSWSYSANQFQFIVSGITNGHYVVEATTNLSDWTSISTNIATFTNIDLSVTNFPYRFYRSFYQP